jgi:peptidyl-prolyl cis-trans isomerase SurA
MQYKTIILKHIKPLFIVFFSLIAINVHAQKIKIDGVAVVIGKNIVLDSDIDKFKQEVELRSEGKITISDCDMLEELMQQKLLAHHAVVDSVVVNDVEVSARVERSIKYFTQQYGSVEKVVKTYGFNDLEDLKKELTSVQKENLLIEKEQLKITEKIDVTPEEVRLYYNGLKEKGELPQFPAEIQLAQIVLKAKPTEEENNRVINKLEEIKEQIEDGLVKEFKEMAFSLDVNQVSKPFKSQFGYHIMQLHDVKGNTRIASHILLQPQVSDDKLAELKDQAYKIVNDIKTDKISFEAAAKKYSTDKDTKYSGGLIINPSTGESKFDLTRMDPAFYARVSDLKKGDVSDVFYDEEGGEKMYKFILMKDRADTHKADLVKDYVKIQQLALTKKKEETIEKWAKDKIKDTYIKLGEENKKCEFKRNWKKEKSK